MSFFSNEKTFTNLETIPLLTANRADPDGRRFAMTYGQGDQQSYIDNYIVGFQRNYRRRFSKNRLAKEGFLPEVASVSKIDQQAVLDFLGATSLVSFVQVPPSTAYALDWAHDYLENTYDAAWSNATSILTNTSIGGVTGDWELTGASSSTDGGGQFENILIMTSLSGHGTQLLRNYYPDDKKQYYIAKYHRSNTTTEWYIDIGLASTLPADIYDSVDLEMTPIVTIKENNIMYSEDNFSTDRMLDKMGLDGTNLREQIEYKCDDPDWEPELDPITGLPIDHPNNTCPKENEEPSDIDNAYIMIGLYPGSQEMGEIAGLYHTFDKFHDIADDTGYLQVSITSLELLYGFDVVKTFDVEGVIEDAEGNPLKRLNYSNEILENGNPDCEPEGGIGPLGQTCSTMTLRYQKSATHYDEIVVSNYYQTYTIKSAEADGGDFGYLYYADEEEGRAISRMIVPLDVYNDLRYKLWLDAYEYGLIMVAYSVETVKLKWYETGIFRIVIMIIAAYFGPLGSYAANFILAAVMSIVATAVAQMIDIPILKVVVMMILAYMGGGLQFDLNTLMSFDNFLPMMNKVVEVAGAIKKTFEMEDLDKLEEELDEAEREAKEMEEKLEELTGPQVTLFVGNHNMNTTSQQPGGVISPDDWFYEQYGEDMFNMGRLYNVDNAYTQRKNIKLTS